MIDHPYIVIRMNARAERLRALAERQRALAPFKKAAIIGACLIVCIGLVASIGYASADVGVDDSQPVAFQQDSNVLVGLLNGHRYALDAHHAVHCSVYRLR